MHPNNLCQKLGDEFRQREAIKAAHHAVANPVPGASALSRTIAWVALKTARGQTVRQSNLPRPTNLGDA